ncbi:hypothetical protein [Ancylobacter polymorphus]|uniref:Uncharacterized protein n=1 Tax=Ancylobacter polymorphus TaxID=223390 RepID=A0ABU0BFH6_9HYPH|nr:hypothetical protein [Ancylobacter polymorphus]MDQ0304165.1 hypothetical protein [Ancylobacter polymorphus]
MDISEAEGRAGSEAAKCGIGKTLAMSPPLPALATTPAATATFRRNGVARGGQAPYRSFRFARALRKKIEKTRRRLHARRLCAGINSGIFAVDRAGMLSYNSRPSPSEGVARRMLA